MGYLRCRVSTARSQMPSSSSAANSSGTRAPVSPVGNLPLGPVGAAQPVALRVFFWLDSLMSSLKKLLDVSADRSAVELQSSYWALRCLPGRH
jgi:hypothetical protein